MVLKDSTLLFHTYDCDSIYCKMNREGMLFTLFSSASADAPLYYKIGFDFVKDFSNSILFKHSCPGVGPCAYSLVNKDFGLVVENFEELIYDGKGDSNPYIIYFSSDNYIIVHDIEENTIQKFMYPVQRFNSLFPVAQFDKVEVASNQIVMSYTYTDKKGQVLKDKLNLNLKEGIEQ